MVPARVADSAGVNKCPRCWWTCHVPTDPFSQPVCVKFRAWVLFKQLWTGYLKTLQNNCLRNSWHSCPSRQTKLQLKTVKTWDVWIQEATGSVNFVVEGSMCWESCASRSALSSWSPGRKKNKIHAALGIKNPKSSKELGLEEIVLSCLMMASLFQAFPSWMDYLRGYPC